MISAFCSKINSLPVLAAVLAAGYLGYALIQLVLPPDAGELQTGLTDGASPIVPPPQQPEQPPPDYAQIGNWHLFGRSEDALSSEEGAPTETQLQLKLQGVLIVPGQERHAHAIIATPDQMQKTYRINDELPGGAKLKAIEKDKIILAGPGGQEFLALQKHVSE